MIKAHRHIGTKAQRGKTNVIIRRSLTVLCLLLMFFPVADGFGADSAAGGLQDSLRIVVSQITQVSGERILMGQVAKISGGDETLRQEIAGIDLGPAPRAGQERPVSGNAIAVALADNKKLPEGSKTVIPDTVVVKGAYQELSEASLEGAFKRYVKKAAGGDEVAFSRMDVRGIKPLPVGNVSLTPVGGMRGKVKGNTTLRLAVAVNGESCGQVTVSGWVDRYAQVVFTARPIDRDTILSKDDLCLKRINIAKAPDQLVFHIADAVGKRVRSSFQAGKCLQQHKLFEVPLVEKGDRVKLLVDAGPVKISTLGIAKTDGGAGDQIRVENVSSRKMVVGRVVDASTVEVLF